MEQLISTARIGRSLGVHLILATQKPSGVVNEQIWANSKFKVCLKVQDRADSMDMLKRPDAAEIAETGRFYLQVGYNELFELGQSAWCGAAYMDSDTVAVGDDLSIDVVDDLGEIVDRIKDKNSSVASGNGKQIVRIMEYLDKLAEEEDIHERQLWMPEISEVILWDEVAAREGFAPEKNTLEALIGMLDDPYHQDQRMLTLNLTSGGNALLYDAGGNNSEMMLEALLYSLYKHYDSSELRTCILDFGSESLRMFEKAPCTEKIIVDGEDEGVAELFSVLKNEIKNRKKILSQYGGDLVRYNSSENKRIPYMLIILNNLSHFSESCPIYEESLMSVTRDCAKYGIYFVITANSSGAVRYRLAQNFSQNLVMQLNDPTDYAAILGKVGGIYPPNIKGRGIIMQDEVYIYQTASIVSSEQDLFTYVGSFCEKLNDSNESVDNMLSEKIPAKISGEKLSESMPGFNEVPLGLCVNGGEPYKLDMCSNNLLHVLSKDINDSLNFAAGMCETVSKIDGIRIVLINTSDEFEQLIRVKHDRIGKETLTSGIVELIDEGSERNRFFKEKGLLPQDKKPIFVVINRIDEIKASLSREKMADLNILLEKVEGYTGIHFMIVADYSSVSKYSAYNWYLDKIVGRGLCIGKGVSEQNWFRFNGKSELDDDKIGSSTGFMVENEDYIKIRTVLPALLCGEENE